MKKKSTSHKIALFPAKKATLRGKELERGETGSTALLSSDAKTQATPKPRRSTRPVAHRATDVSGPIVLREESPVHRPTDFKRAWTSIDLF